jgi:zinc protease
MLIIVVGDFDDDVLESSLKSIFNMPQVAQPLNRPKYNLPAPKKGSLDIEILTDAQQTYYEAYFYYKRSPKKLANNLYNVREVFIATLISEMINMRFDDKSREQGCPYTRAWAELVAVRQSSRFYLLGSVSREDNLQDTIKSVLQEKESVLRYGFTQSEIDRAKASVISYFEEKASEKRVESFLYLNAFVDNAIGKQPIVVDDEWIFNAAKKLMPLITAKELNNTFRSYFKEDALTIFTICPETENLISKEEVSSIIKDIKKSKIPAPVNNILKADLLDKEPVAGTILKEHNKKFDALELELSNGVKVILKKTTNKNDQITLYALANGGIFNCDYPYKDLKQYVVSARLYSQMYINSGLGKYSYQEIIKKLSDKNIGFEFGVDNFERYFSGQISVKDTKTFFEIVYLLFSEPKIEPDSIKYVVNQYRTDLLNEDKSPERVFSKEISKIIYNNNPYFTQLEILDLDKVNKKQ